MTEEVELLQSLIRNACVNDGGPAVSEVANADAVRAVLEGVGLDVEVFDAAPGRRSVIARIAGDVRDAPTLMLLGHTDVVPALADRWAHDPFGGELIDGFVWGRGALDMLGHVATMALALRDHARSGGRGGDVVFAAVADEEAFGGFGTRWLLENEPEAVHADWVITETGGTSIPSSGEARLSVLAAEKGAWRVRLTVTGEPGHAAMPFGSVNALTLAAEVCARLAAFAPVVSITQPWRDFVDGAWDERIKPILTDPARVDAALPLLPPFAAKAVHALTRMTATATAITGSGSSNTIPGSIDVDVDVRVLPGQDVDDVDELLTSALGELREHVVVQISDGFAATASPVGTPLWNLMQRAARVQRPGALLVPTMAPGMTDARFFRQLGATAYGFGMYSDRLPVDQIPAMVHGDDERVDVESLADMRQLWTTVLDMHADATGQVR